MPITDNLDQKSELRHILDQEAITPLFQPIVDLKEKCVFGYEALSRAPTHSSLHMPDQLFCAAREHNMLFELDRLCRKLAIARFQQIALQQKLFINLDPISLLDPHYQNGTTAEILQFYRLTFDRVVIELTEHSQVDDIESLKQAVSHYRSMGFSIALDDLGTGYSSLQLMAELKPEFIKLDKYFIRKLPTDAVAHEFARAICKLAKKTSCAVIAEGVETMAELDEVYAIQADFAQGYFFAQPMAIPDAKLPAEFTDKNKSLSKAAMEPVDITVTSRELCHYLQPSEPNTTGYDILKRFQKNEELLAIPIVLDGNVVGICERHSLLKQFSERYGHALYASKQVSALMNGKPLCVELHTPIEELSQLAMKRAKLLLYEPVILLDHGRYAGMAYVSDLLEKITKISIHRAMECNPLTHLPGNHAIENEVHSRLTKQQSFILCYFDLDNFKVFNDRYGFERGDTMIRVVADILRERAKDADFVGHIGGDDFVLIMRERHEWQCEVENIMSQFLTIAHQLYDANDLAIGEITARDREGNSRTFSLTSLSVGAVPCPPGRYTSHLQLSEVAVELKHRAKQQKGNCLIVDRRQTDFRHKCPESML